MKRTQASRWTACVLLLSAYAQCAPPAAVIRDGSARFEVLSPTLIRSEYAGDNQFIDAATFNVIGRNQFGQPQFSSSSQNGWLTITTSALTLQYKSGSGAFNRDNLKVQLAVAGQRIQGAPWSKPACSVGQRCEVENATANISLNGLGTAANHTGFGGDGFVAGYEQTGNALQLTLNVPNAGQYQLAVRYANGVGGDGQHIQRSLTFALDNGAGQSLALPLTTDWDTWAVATTAPVFLTAGQHSFSLTRTANDSGDINLDSLALVTENAAYPPPVCENGATCQAEDGTLSGSAQVAHDHASFSGSGFVAELNQGAAWSTQVQDVPTTGTYTLTFRYANGAGGDGLYQTRNATLAVAGGTYALAFPVTDNWDAWSTLSTQVALQAGANTLAIQCPDAASCHINLDSIKLSRPALGGYRRSVDVIDGVAPTTPGLLYQDGWYLLDDTTSALYNPGTRALTVRPSHGGQAYQDGYVFAYGHNYKQGLADLAQLTGRSILLPRWAYGVWYSEYYDRTAAMYQNTILPQFRADNVPLDVLVTDTDFKAPNTWDGWEIDTAKFPDPTAYFAWLHGQGLHTTFNIHSSIAGSDPQFSNAQSIARNKLGKTGFCGSPANSDPAGCYGFNWADADQLAAYFALHQTMARQGVDFWWLDLCCDGAQVVRSDITSDAWINQKYADQVATAVGRGFAFSRTYGVGPWNNQPDEPTGPWADKRTTVHFTGDAFSTWKMLAAEVGYTVAESASTGLSAVSHDIGGFNRRNDQTTGAEPGSYKMPEDLYARWVQFGTFQPIDRLHGDHSDRLPWQYGVAAKESAEKFLRLREALVPYIYTMAHEATQTGVPVARATYLEYPELAQAYQSAASEYFFGDTLLVAPITSPGDPAATSVWFPDGQWTDFFTGRTYGAGTQSISSPLNEMPVFIRAGGIVPLRGSDVANDVQHPLSSVTLLVAAGANGHFSLYEDDGKTTDPSQSATTAMDYRETAAGHELQIHPLQGMGPVNRRSWNGVFMNVNAPTSVMVNGTALAGWTYDSASRKLSVPLAERAVSQNIVVTVQ